MGNSIPKSRLVVDDVAVTDNNPLHEAIIQGNSARITSLLKSFNKQELEIDINKKNSNGHRPIDLAICKGQYFTAHQLIMSNAIIDENTCEIAKDRPGFLNLLLNSKNIDQNIRNQINHLQKQIQNIKLVCQKIK